MITEEQAVEGFRVVVTGDTISVSHQFERGTVGTIVRTRVNSSGRATASTRVMSDDGQTWWVGLADLVPLGNGLACNCGCGVR